MPRARYVQNVRIDKTKVPVNRDEQVGEDWNWNRTKTYGFWFAAFLVAFLIGWAGFGIGGCNARRGVGIITPPTPPTPPIAPPAPTVTVNVPAPTVVPPVVVQQSPVSVPSNINVQGKFDITERPEQYRSVWDNPRNR